MPMVIESCSHPQIRALSGKGGNEWTFRVALDDEIMAYTFARYMARQGVKIVVHPRHEQRLRPRRRHRLRRGLQEGEHQARLHRVLRPRPAGLPPGAHAAQARRRRDDPRRHPGQRRRALHAAVPRARAHARRSTRAAASPPPSSSTRCATTRRSATAWSRRATGSTGLDPEWDRKWQERHKIPPRIHGSLAAITLKWAVVPAHRDRAEEAAARSTARRIRAALDRGRREGLAARPDQVRRQPPGVDQHDPASRCRTGSCASSRSSRRARRS